MLLRFIGENFPTAPQQPPATALTPEPKPVAHDPVCLQNKEALLERVRRLKLPPNFLDEVFIETQ